MRCSVAVHGGAGNLSPEDDPAACTEGCLAAARAGRAVLEDGGSALDAVVAAVVVLEDNPLFNAGTGSTLNVEGDVEMDASVMDGDGGRAGAVALIRTVRNPIRLARLVMEATPHVLLAAEGAEAFAREQGVPAIPAGSLVTERARLRWAQARDQEKPDERPAGKPHGRSDEGHGTVGAVAFDGLHVAAATSTGGTFRKRRGRIGDSPLIGCGTYALDEAGAASCTGLGEAIIRAVLAKSAVDRLARGQDPTDAATEVLSLLSRHGGDGGLILIDAQGRIGIGFSSQRMARAWIDTEGRSGVGFGSAP